VTGPVAGPIAGPVAGAPTPASGRSDDARLRQAARQLTGLFAQQLFKAMRETVPQGEGVVSGGSGEEMFTGMLDEHLAGAAPGRAGEAGAAARGPGAAWTRALADAGYRRMRPGAEAAPDHSAGPVTPMLDGASLTRPTPYALTPGVPPAGRR
jgi:flagellar protein FlgJ